VTEGLLLAGYLSLRGACAQPKARLWNCFFRAAQRHDLERIRVERIMDAGSRGINHFETGISPLYTPGRARSVDRNRGRSRPLHGAAKDRLRPWRRRPRSIRSMRSTARRFSQPVARTRPAHTSREGPEAFGGRYLASPASLVATTARLPMPYRHRYVCTPTRDDDRSRAEAGTRYARAVQSGRSRSTSFARRSLRCDAAVERKVRHSASQSIVRHASDSRALIDLRAPVDLQDQESRVEATPSATNAHTCSGHRASTCVLTPAQVGRCITAARVSMRGRHVDRDDARRCRRVVCTVRNSRPHPDPWR